MKQGVRLYRLLVLIITPTFSQSLLSCKAILQWFSDFEALVQSSSGPQDMSRQCFLAINANSTSLV